MARGKAVTKRQRYHYRLKQQEPEEQGCAPAVAPEEAPQEDPAPAKIEEAPAHPSVPKWLCASQGIRYTDAERDSSRRSDEERLANFKRHKAEMMKAAVDRFAKPAGKGVPENSSSDLAAPSARHAPEIAVASEFSVSTESKQEPPAERHAPADPPAEAAAPSERLAPEEPPTEDAVVKGEYGDVDFGNDDQDDVPEEPTPQSDEPVRAVFFKTPLSSSPLPSPRSSL